VERVVVLEMYFKESEIPAYQKFITGYNYGEYFTDYLPDLIDVAIYCAGSLWKHWETPEYDAKVEPSYYTTVPYRIEYPWNPCHEDWYNPKMSWEEAIITVFPKTDDYIFNQCYYHPIKYESVYRERLFWDVPYNYNTEESKKWDKYVNIEYETLSSFTYNFLVPDTLNVDATFANNIGKCCFKYISDPSNWTPIYDSNTKTDSNGNYIVTSNSKIVDYNYNTQVQVPVFKIDVSKRQKLDEFSITFTFHDIQSKNNEFKIDRRGISYRIWADTSPFSAVLPFETEKKYIVQFEYHYDSNYTKQLYLYLRDSNNNALAYSLIENPKSVTTLSISFETDDKLNYPHFLKDDALLFEIIDCSLEPEVHVHPRIERYVRPMRMAEFMKFEFEFLNDGKYNPSHLRILFVKFWNQGFITYRIFLDGLDNFLDLEFEEENDEFVEKFVLNMLPNIKGVVFDSNFINKMKFEWRIFTDIYVWAYNLPVTGSKDKYGYHIPVTTNIKNWVLIGYDIGADRYNITDYFEVNVGDRWVPWKEINFRLPCPGYKTRDGRWHDIPCNCGGDIFYSCYSVYTRKLFTFIRPIGYSPHLNKNVMRFLKVLAQSFNINVKIRPRYIRLLKQASPPILEVTKKVYLQPKYHTKFRETFDIVFANRFDKAWQSVRRIDFIYEFLFGHNTVGFYNKYTDTYYHFRDRILYTKDFENPINHTKVYRRYIQYLPLYIIDDFSVSEFKMYSTLIHFTFENIEYHSNANLILEDVVKLLEEYNSKWKSKEYPPKYPYKCPDISYHVPPSINRELAFKWPNVPFSPQMYDNYYFIPENENYFANIITPYPSEYSE